MDLKFLEKVLEDYDDTPEGKKNPLKTIIFGILFKLKEFDKSSSDCVKQVAELKEAETIRKTNESIWKKTLPILLSGIVSLIVALLVAFLTR